MKRDWLQFLVCPECGGELVCSSDEDEILEASLSCENRHNFTVRNGIPRFVEASDDSELEQTKKSFGEKWKLADNYGFDETTKSFHLKWFMERFGFSDEMTLKRYLWKQNFILDAGCGTGRLTNMLCELEAINWKGTIFAIDISGSVDVTKSNLTGKDNVFIIQADLNKLPFSGKFFDMIVCDMVLHHTPNPEASFKKLVSHLKEEGELFAYVYKVKGPVREYSDTAIRSFTTNMPFERCYKFSEIVTRFGKELAEFDPELQRFFYWHILKCFWNEKHGWDYSVITNFDWYHPKYAFRYNVEDLKRWFDDAGVNARRVYVGNSGISFVVRYG